MLPNTAEIVPSLPITHSDIRQVCGNEILASDGALGRPASISYRGASMPELQHSRHSERS